MDVWVWFLLWSHSTVGLFIAGKINKLQLLSWLALMYSETWVLLSRAGVRHHPAEVCSALPGIDWQASDGGGGRPSVQTRGGVPGRRIFILMYSTGSSQDSRERERESIQINKGIVPVFSTDWAMGQCRVVSRLRHVRAPGADSRWGALRSALVGNVQCQTQTDAGLLMAYIFLHQGSKTSNVHCNALWLCFFPRCG